MPTFLRFAGRWSIALPSIRTDPALCRTNPATTRSSVVLPHPEGPRSATISPARTASDTSATAVTGPYRWVTESMSRVWPCSPLIGREDRGITARARRAPQAPRRGREARPRRPGSGLPLRGGEVRADDGPAERGDLAVDVAPAQVHPRECRLRPAATPVGDDGDRLAGVELAAEHVEELGLIAGDDDQVMRVAAGRRAAARLDRKSTRLNSSHLVISYAVFCLKKKKKQKIQ